MEKSRKTFADIINEAMVAANTMDHDKLLFSYKGILYPATFCSPEIFRAMDFLEARSDDIILAGYPKSGTNWLGQVLNDLVAIFEKKAQNKESSVNYEEMQEFPYLEMGDTGKYEVGTEYIVMVTHLLSENLPSSIFRNKAKVNVATSFYHFSNGMSHLPSYETWDDFFIAFMTKKMPWGCYFEYLSKWNKYADDENVMTITYEELKEVRLPILLSLESSFQSMKKNSLKTHGKHGDVFFRKGGVSDWKNLFSEDQNETSPGAQLIYTALCLLHVAPCE
uniref:Sulfotransferase n=1 Tax=Melopsittacus undulatus TaxID=13146 RepID=A0A8C6ITD7_MELUD